MKLRLLVLAIPRLPLVAVAAVVLPGLAVAAVAAGVMPLAGQPGCQNLPYLRPLTSDVRSAPWCAAVLPLPDSSR